MERPNKLQIQRASTKTLKDVIAPNLTILFCGINPGLYSAAVGHNFARPGNRFWPTMFGAGFTDRLLSAAEERELLNHGYGITNIVKRATASASELSKEELIHGAQLLKKKVLRFKPQCLAVVGISAYRTAFEVPHAKIGLQEDRIDNTIIWVLPNPSGLNAHHQLPQLIAHFRDLRDYLTTSLEGGPLCPPRKDKAGRHGGRPSKL